MDKIDRIHADKSVEEVRKALADYVANTMTSREVATKHEVCPATLTVWAKKAGLLLRSRGRRTLLEPTPRHRQILKLAETQRYDQIGKRLGMHKQQVHRIVKRWSGWGTVKLKKKLKDKGWFNGAARNAPFAPGDVVVWGSLKLTVVDAGPETGTLRDDKADKTYLNFPWHGPRPVIKIGVNRKYCVPRR